MLVVAMILAGAVSAAPVGQPEPRRIALVVGENEGDLTDERLRFAERDARRMAEVLREVGAVAPADLHPLYGATAADLRHQLKQVLQKVAASGDARAELFVYISSHADEGALRLRGTRFPMHELTAALRETRAPVAVLVVDSCQSGALTRSKGLRRVGGTAVEVETPDIRGRVIISSSSADEYAQESDELQGSYFTHHLVAALRGAADASGDGRVTLQEAYAYSYARTVETTFATRGGIQHPTYSVDLKGRGELVLSELNRGQGRLTVDVDAPGEWLVLSETGSDVVARFQKARGRVSFALAPGSYRLRARQDRGYLEAHRVVPAGGAVTVRAGDLREVNELETTIAKGVGTALTVAIGGVASSPSTTDLSVLWGASLSGRVQLRDGAFTLDEIWSTISWARGSAHGAHTHHEVDARVGTGWTWRPSSFVVGTGPEVGALLLRQEGVPGGPRTALQPYAGWTLSGGLPLAGRFGALFTVGAGAALIRGERTGLGPIPRVNTSAALTWAF